MKKNRLYKTVFLTFLAACATLALPLLFTGCSSAPKRPMMETTVYQQALDRYEAANAQLISFQNEQAVSNLAIAERLARSIDNVDLLCKIYLSAVIYRLTSDVMVHENPTVFDKKNAEVLLADARKFASRSQNRQFLEAVSAVYEQKILLAQKNGYSADAILDARKDFSKDPFYMAFSSRTLGDIYTAQKDYQKAGTAYKEAAALHIKNRYLVEIGLDYFCLARSYSLSGDKNGALDSLNTALSYDKAAENSGAIASDYLALAKILSKNPKDESEVRKAKEAALWAKEIFESAGLEPEAESAGNFASSL